MANLLHANVKGSSDLIAFMSNTSTSFLAWILSQSSIFQLYVLLCPLLNVSH